MIGTGHTRYVIVALSLGIIGRYAGHKLDLRGGRCEVIPYSSQYWLQCLPTLTATVSRMQNRLETWHRLFQRFQRFPAFESAQ